MVRTRRTNKKKQHQQLIKCMQIENNVISYLNTPSDNKKSIAFYGTGGEGKSTLKNRLMPYFKEHGYINFISGEIPISLGIDTRNIKRSNTWVVDTYDDDILHDERFIVFDFTK